MTEFPFQIPIFKKKKNQACDQKLSQNKIRNKKEKVTHTQMIKKAKDSIFSFVNAWELLNVLWIECSWEETLPADQFEAEYSGRDHLGLIEEGAQCKTRSNGLQCCNVIRVWQQKCEFDLSVVKRFIYLCGSGSLSSLWLHQSHWKRCKWIIHSKLFNRRDNARAWIVA